MRLHMNVASPFARKVRVVAIETGLADRIEEVTWRTSPVAPYAGLIEDNPLAKIPCLVTDEGASLYDSRVIAEYLDGLHDGPRLFPQPGPARWTALRRQAQGDGIMDAGVLVRYETSIRPEPLRWDAWIEAQKDKFRRTLDVIEREAEQLQGAVDVGTISIACGLGYLDFRYPDEGWRGSRPGLAAWFDAFAARRSMVETVPQEIW